MIGVKSEHSEQSAVIEWKNWRTAMYPELELLYAIPNAGKRSKITGAIMKREGLMAGVPDLCLPVARKGFNALYIEMKVGKNKTTELQRDWIEKLKKHNNRVEICYGSSEAINVISDYLDIKQ